MKVGSVSLCKRFSYIHGGNNCVSKWVSWFLDNVVGVDLEPICAVLVPIIKLVCLLELHSWSELFSVTRDQRTFMVATGGGLLSLFPTSSSPWLPSIGSASVFSLAPIRASSSPSPSSSTLNPSSFLEPSREYILPVLLMLEKAWGSISWGKKIV